MIESRTPLRISLLGGGTDYPEWFMKYGGAVIATAINKYVWVRYENGYISFDVPPLERSGLATSSAKTVGALKILDVNCDPMLISALATQIEREKLAGNVGFQDQYICTYGGFRYIEFSNLGTRAVELKGDWLEPYLILFHTQQRRARAGDVVASQLEQMDNHAELYGDLMKLVNEGLSAINAEDWEWLGNILHESWVVKKGLSDKITTDAIDDIYNRGLGAGAVGGKLLGAGGGGTMLFAAEPSKHEVIKKALRECWHIPFKFEKEGTKIIHKED